MPTCWCRTIPEAAAVSGARCAGKLFRHPPHPCQRGTCGTLHGTYVCGDRPAPTSRTGQIDAGDQTFRRQSAFPDDANRRQLRSEAQRMPAVHDLHLTRMGKRQPRKPQFALIDLDPAFPDFGMGGGGQLKADLRLMILVPASWIEKPLASDETVLWCTQPKRLRYPSWDATMCQPRPLSTRSRLADALCDQLKAPDMTLWSAPSSASVLWARVLRNQSRHARTHPGYRPAPGGRHAGRRRHADRPRSLGGHRRREYPAPAGAQWHRPAEAAPDRRSGERNRSPMP